LDIQKLKKTLFQESAFSICLTLSPRSLEELQEHLFVLPWDQVDLLEWRGDYMEDPRIQVFQEGFRKINEASGHRPLIFTLRAKEEGGQGGFRDEALLQVRQALVKEKDFFILDMESSYFLSGHPMAFAYHRLLEDAKKRGHGVLLSYHNFTETPADEVLLEILRKQQKLGGDLLKVAVLAEKTEDVERLMALSHAASRKLKQPIIAISMGEKGMVSRYDAKKSASCMTYVGLTEEVAPGQLSLAELREKLGRK